MGNNIATYTICIDVEKVADIKDIEDKIKKRLRQAFSLYPDILDRMLNLINSRDEHKLPCYIRVVKINGVVDGDTASEIISYIEDNLSGICAVDALRGKVKKEVLVTGS